MLPKTAQALARHSTISLTLDRYTHAALGDEVRVIEAFPRLMGRSATMLGALLLTDGIPSATSSSDGRVRLAGPTWPVAVRVKAAGHAPLELDARELLFEAVLLLDPP